MRALSAPSKLFLAGEYAVLWGGTARIAAVGPRAQALVRRREDREVHLILEDGRFTGQATPLGVRWSGDVPRQYLFVARAIDAVWRVHGRESLGFEVAFAPSPGAPGGRKLGLGSSARACLLATEAARFILEERLDSLKLALLSHAQTQGMKGSGGDVAAVFAGGVVRYRRYPVETLFASTGTGQLSSALVAAEPVDLWRLPPPKVFLS
ncbi:MAG: mevalonate kinase family protein, partial [Myxococcaceae bacterium]